MQVVVDNLLTTYEKTGKGPVVLMLHGWGDSSGTFRQLIAQLRSGFTLIAVDLPGFGQTEAPADVWNLDAYARFVQSFLDKLAIKPYAIVGHSNGGALAIRGLSEHILAADKLVLLGAAGIRDRQSLRRFSLKLIAKTGKQATFWLPTRHKKALQKRFYGAIGSDLLVAPHLQETFKITVRQDVQQDAAKLKLPTLLIYGEADQATPPHYGQLYHRLIAGSKLQLIPSAEHFVHQDQPEKVAQLIMEFLA